MRKTLIAACVALAAALLPVGESHAAPAPTFNPYGVFENALRKSYTSGQIWTYVNSNYGYGGPLAATYQLGNTDCTDSWIAGMTFWTGNGTGAGGVISSLNANVGNRVNCNVIGVKAWLAPNGGGAWLTQCMSHNNGGIPGFGAPWNDNTQFVAIWHYGGCPPYWA